MTLFLQGQEYSGPVNPNVNYREGFRQHVLPKLVGHSDRVVLIEPNPSRAHALRELWSEVPNVQILDAHLDFLPITRPRISYYFKNLNTDNYVFSPDGNFVQRFHPGAKLRSVEVPRISIEEIVNTYGQRSNLETMSVDLRFQVEILSNDSAAFFDTCGFKEIVFVTQDIDPHAITEIKKSAKTRSYIAAGRPWGAAKTNTAFASPNTFTENTTYRFRQTKVVAGKALETTKNLIPNPSKRWRLKQQVSIALTAQYSRKDSLDSGFQYPLSVVPRYEVEEVIHAAVSNDFRSWSVQLEEESISSIAAECHAQHGVWPISFSYPTEGEPFENVLTTLSPITPGFPYSFTDEQEYLRVYGQAALGLTHRKAGWDCFRHLEILASGSVPLMMDAEQIPRYSMIHYPKKALTQIARNSRQMGGRPSEQTRLDLREHFQQHLTSRAMARYLLESAGLLEAQSVLFIDEHTSSNPEYLSTLTLIGLKQLLGQKCDVQFPADVLYSDYQEPVTQLYGRGFGYTKRVEPTARTQREWLSKNGDIPSEVELRDYDCVIVGSLVRNPKLTLRVLNEVSPEKVIMIHGEDLPPNIYECHWYRETGANVFVRAIHRP